MLQQLHIRNLALLEETRLEFEKGFIAVTGETGAGKSILLGALSLLAGARAEKTLIRQGAECCEVEAVLQFANSSRLDARLEALGLPVCEEGVFLLRRTIARSRAGQVQVNGRLATLAVLQELGECWIDFHGPGEPQKLFHESWQLELLDRFAQAGETLGEYTRRYEKWRAIQRRIEELRTTEQLDPDEADFLKRQLEAFDRVEISVPSIEALERDHTRLSQAQEIIRMADQISRGLGGEDDGVTETLGPLLQTARELARLDTAALSIAQRLESLVIESADLAGEASHLAEGCSFDAEESRLLEERMAAWLELRRKYGGTVQTVLARREQMVRRLASQTDLAGQLETLQAQAAAALEEAVGQARILRQLRDKAAGELAAKTAGLLKSLGFKKARLEIEVWAEDGLREHGDSACRIRFSPNVGQDVLPLNKIASSGEAARVMLALKAILARVDETPVLVFDEVDANVGGEIARVVGRELAGLGRAHQVFCVTHLPQVAALAASHYVVEKVQTSDTTTVDIRAIQGGRQERLTELARMLGDRASAAALSHAEELLAASNP